MLVNCLCADLRVCGDRKDEPQDWSKSSSMEKINLAERWDGKVENNEEMLEKNKH